VIIHLLWAAVVVYVVHRAMALAERFVPVRSDATEASASIPADLMAYAMSHSESWAQEDAVRAIQQSYEQWKDWNRVRSAMGIGGMD